MNITLLLSKIGLSSNLSQDMTLILFIALISFVYGMVLGKKKLMSILVSIYIAFAIISVVPIEISYKAYVFLGLLVVLTLVSRKIFDIHFASGGSAFMWRIFIVSFFQVILIISVMLSMLPQADALSYVSSTAYSYLVSGWAPLTWMAIPLVAMFILHRKSRY